MQEPVALQGIFSKATTLVDGGWRVSFDLSEQMGDQVAELTKLRGIAIYVIAMTPEQFMEQKG